MITKPLLVAHSEFVNSMLQREMVDTYEDLMHGDSVISFSLEEDIVNRLRVMAFREGMGIGRFVSKVVVQYSEAIINAYNTQTEPNSKGEASTEPS